MTNKKPLTERQQKNLWDKMMRESLETIEANPITCLIYYTLKTADPSKNHLELQADVIRIMKKTFPPSDAA